MKLSVRFLALAINRFYCSVRALGGGTMWNDSRVPGLEDGGAALRSRRAASPVWSKLLTKGRSLLGQAEQP